MANSTFSGPVRSENGFQDITKDGTTGAVTTNSTYGTNASVGGTLAVTGAAGTATSFGTKKFQTFAGTLAGTNAATTAYADGDVLVELGTLDVTAPSGIVTPTKIFFDKAVIGITTAAGQTLAGTLKVSATSGTATNAAPTTPTEIVGAGVTAFDPLVSAAASVTEVDINFNNTAGNYHLFTPNITADVGKIYLYACTTTAINADITAGRFTVNLEYTLF